MLILTFAWKTVFFQIFEDEKNDYTEESNDTTQNV